MSTAKMPLPPSVLQSLEALGRRVRMGQTLRGLGLLFAALAAIFGVGFSLDETFGLGTPELRFGLILTAVVVLTIGVRRLLMPWLRPASAETLAALLETKHPELAERFTSLIHLERTSEESHGSPAFKQALAEQTEQAVVDVTRAYPLKSPTRAALAGMAVYALLLLVGSTPFFSFCQRMAGSFGAPWHGFTLRVTPGNHAFAQGNAVKITANVDALPNAVRLPSECVLVTRDGEGREKRTPMGKRDGGFAHEMPTVDVVTSYRVEAGGASSEEFTLTPVAPVFLAEGGYRAIVSPPPYSTGSALESKRTDPLQGKQYGKLELAFDLNRAPVKGKVVWKDEKGVVHELPAMESLTWEGTAGKGSWVLPETGRFAGTLVLEAEHGVAFSQALPVLDVAADEAPRVELSLSRPGTIVSGAVAVPPGDALLFHMVARDDEGLGAMAWEWNVNGGKANGMPFRDGLGKRLIEDDILFTLPSELKAGDRCQLTMRVQDNRVLKKGSILTRDGLEVPARDLSAQSAVFSISLVVQDVDPVRKREVLAMRDEIDAALKALVKKVDALRGDVGNLRAGSHQQPRLRPDQEKRLEKHKETNQELRLDMLMLAEKLSEEGGLDPLAQKLEDLVRQELAESQAALDGLSKADATMRDKEFHKSEDRLLKSSRKLQDMYKLNEALAQDRLDRFKLRTLAGEEEKLAGTLKKGDADLKKIQDEQDRIRKELETLLKESPLLGGMMKDRDKERVEEAVKRLEGLANDAREMEAPDLAKMGKESLDALAQIAKEQAELAKRVDAWQMGAEKDERVEHPRRAAEAMDKSAWMEALSQQKHAEEGLRLRSDLIETGGRSDLRQKVLHLAKTQESIYRDLFQLGEELPRLKPSEQMERLAKIEKAQQGLERELNGLKLPEKASASHAQAKGIVGEIVALQGRKDYLGAFLKMEEAPQTLQGLAFQLPEGIKGEGKEEPKEAKIAKEKANAGRALGEDQTGLRQRLEKLLADAEGQGAKQRAENAKAMREKAEQAAADLLKLSQKMEPTPGKGKMEGAAKMAQEAAKAMQAAEKAPAKESLAREKEAALKLEMAGKMAREAMDEAKLGKGKDELAMRDPKAAKDVESGKRDLDQASMDLKKGDSAGAAKAMARAAQAMRQASTEPKASKKSLASGRGKGKTPASKGIGPIVSGKVPEKALEKFDAKTWGELPGEVKAQLILDLQQRFGVEYQPVIQRYFENLSRENERKRSTP